MGRGTLVVQWLQSRTQLTTREAPMQLAKPVHHNKDLSKRTPHPKEVHVVGLHASISQDPIPSGGAQGVRLGAGYLVMLNIARMESYQGPLRVCSSG